MEEINANIDRILHHEAFGTDLKRLRQEFAVGEEEDNVKASFLRSNGVVDRSWS